MTERTSLLTRDGRALRILYLVTEDWYFCSHRLPIARAARAAGADVLVATRVEAHRAAIEREGFRLVSLPWRRRTDRPGPELATLRDITALYRRERPDIVHHVALKPSVYGGIAAALTACPVRIAAVAGLGYTEASRSTKARLLRTGLRTTLRALWGSTHAIVQNPEDRDALSRARLVASERVHLIRGSGVDVTHLVPLPEPPGRVVAAYAGRLIASKGIRELAQAARLLRERGVPVDVWLVGEPDRENPEAIPEKEVRAWVDSGWLAWHPWTDDIAALWARAAIAVLPSYREGLPKMLLEAAACARPVVTCDVPGCREVTVDGVTGRLVPARDARALADAIESLVPDAALRARLGGAGRERVVQDFSEARVVADTLSLYRKLAGLA